MSKEAADNQNLTARSFKAVSLVLVFQLAAQIFQIVLGICLVRMLEPSDYGIVAMLAIFWAVCNVFVDGGFAQALLQCKTVTPRDLSSVFYYNFGLSLLFCLLMIAAAPWIAAFYGEEILIKTIRVTAWTLPITAAAAVPKVILGRKLMQGKISISQFVGSVVSGIVTLYLAYKGYGVWALVWQNFLAVAVTSLCILLFVRWVPSPIFSFSTLWKHFKYGSKLLASRLLFTFFGYVYNVAIGKVEAKETLGLYEQGRRYAQKIPRCVQSAFDTVLFPAFSKIQDDIPRLRAAYARALQVSMCVFLFTGMAIYALCYPAVSVVLTEKWIPAVPYCRFLVLAILFYPIENLGRNLINSVGKSGTTLFLNVLNLGMLGANVLILFRWGLPTMLVTNIAGTWLCDLLFACFTARELKYPLWRQCRDNLPYVFFSLFACAASWGIYRLLWDWNRIVSLAAGALAAPLLYAALNIFFKTCAWQELAAIWRRRFPRRRKGKEPEAGGNTSEEEKIS